MDTVEANAAFAHKYQFPYPLLSDTDGAACRAYDTCSDSDNDRVERDTYIIDPNGIIKRVYKNVTPKGHINEVLSDMAEQAEVAVAARQITHTSYPEETNFSDKGENEIMDEQQVVQIVENGRDPVSDEQNTPEVAANSVPDLKAAAVMPATNAATPVQVANVSPSQIKAAQPNGSPQLVFAFGTLGVDFGSEARRDSLMQHMDGNPDDLTQLLAYFEENPAQATSVTWTLRQDGTIIYAVMPHGAYASTGYERLREFLGGQLNEGVERVSIPGFIAGQEQLMSGQTVPVIVPELGCMYSWSTAALIKAGGGEPPTKSAKAEEQKAYTRKIEGLANFLQRIYHELRNLGITSQERALNYAAANVANANNVFESALEKNLELHSIDVAPSPICRSGSDCWDVKLLFFDPENVLRAKTVYQFTVDVSAVCPVMVGTVRSWSMP